MCVEVLIKAMVTDSVQNIFDSIDKSNLGVNSDNILLDDLESQLPPEPPISKTGKSFLAVNKSGFNVVDREDQYNWLISEYSEFIQKSNVQSILDLGSGYGRMSHIALSFNKEIVISNDIAIEHLLYTRKIAKLKQLSVKNLYLNNSSFPHDIHMEEQSLDAVVLFRFLHFLPPEDIELGFSKLYSWLKKDGMIFIIVMSPHNKDYSDWFLPIYNARWEAGDKWPGMDLKVADALPEQHYNLPDYLNVMDDRPLRYVLENRGFEVRRNGFISLRNFGCNDANENNSNESFGMAAVKK